MTTTALPPVARHLGSLGDVLLRGVRPLGGPRTDVRIRSARFAEARPAAEPGSGSDATGRHCSGLILLPAFVDLHTHARRVADAAGAPLASETAHAAACGYSDVFVMPDCSPPLDTPGRVQRLLDAARTTASCRVHPVGAVTEGRSGERLAPLAAMARAGVRIFSDGGRCVDDPVLLRAALSVSAGTGTVIAQHPECVRPSGRAPAGPDTRRGAAGPPRRVREAEESSVARDVMLAAATGGRLHLCHASTARTVDLLRWVRARRWHVTAEATPCDLQPVAADDHQVTAVAGRRRARSDVLALRAGLRDGVLDAVAADCRSGVCQTLSVTSDVLGHAGPDWRLTAARLAYGPARVAGIADQVGRAPAQGAPATFTLVDPWHVTGTDTGAGTDGGPDHACGARLERRVVATVVEGFVTYDPHGLLIR